MTAGGTRHPGPEIYPALAAFVRGMMVCCSTGRSKGFDRIPVSHVSGTTSDDRAEKGKSSACGRCHPGPTSVPAATAAGPARRGSLKERCAAQQSTAKRDLDMVLRRGEVNAQSLPEKWSAW